MIDWDAADRQRRKRERDQQKGLVYVQVRVIEKDREALRRYATENGKTLSAFCQEQLHRVAQKVLESESKRTPPPKEETSSQPSTPEKKSPPPDQAQARKKRFLQALLAAFKEGQKTSNPTGSNTPPDCSE